MYGVAVMLIICLGLWVNSTSLVVGGGDLGFHIVGMLERMSSILLKSGSQSMSMEEWIKRAGFVACIGITSCIGIYILSHQSKDQSCSISYEDMLACAFEFGTNMLLLLLGMKRRHFVDV